MSRTNSNVQNTRTTYIDEANLGLLLLSKKIDDVISSKLDALEASTSAEAYDDEDIWKICNEIEASEACRYYREEAERRKRRRELDLKLSKIRSKRAKAAKKSAETAKKKTEFREKLVNGLKDLINTWTVKRTVKLFFAIITVLSTFMFVMYYNIITGVFLSIPVLLMIQPSYIKSRDKLISVLDENSKFLFSIFETFVIIFGAFNVFILVFSGIWLLVFNF